MGLDLVFKVAMLMNKYLPQARPTGIGIVGYELARALSNQGMSVTLFCHGNLLTNHKDDDANLSIVEFPRYTLTVMERLLQNSKSLDFDFFHIHTTSTLPPLLMAKLFGRGLVRHFHGLARGVERRIACELSDRIVVPSNYTKNSFPKKFIQKTEVVYNGVDPEAFKPLNPLNVREKYSLPEKSRIILSVGMVQERKGQQFIIEILNEIAKDFPDIVYVNVGRAYSPQYLQWLESLAEEKVPGRVRFLAGVPQEDLVRLINSATICVHPSLGESFALAIVEQMSCQKSVVAFDNSGTPEIVQHLENGMLVKTRDLRNLKDSIVMLLSDDKLREELGRKARHTVLDSFTWDAAAKKTIFLYKEI